MTQWPDPNKPGYPVNADTSSQHWVIDPQNSDEPFVASYINWRESSGGPCWYDTTGDQWDISEAAESWIYVGPAIPYADAFTAGARAAREMDVARLSGDNSDFWKAADAIQSLPLPELK